MDTNDLKGVQRLCSLTPMYELLDFIELYDAIIKTPDIFNYLNDTYNLGWREDYHEESSFDSYEYCNSDGNSDWSEES